MAKNIEFKNLTVTYDEKKVNKKICNMYTDTFDILCIIIMTINVCFVLLSEYDICTFLSLLISIIMIVAIIIGLIYLSCWFICNKIIKSFTFMKRLFITRNIYTYWFNDEIFISVEYLNGVDYYYGLEGLQDFVSSIKNEIVINDYSEKNKLFHIYIDVTNNNRTEINIVRKEE